MIWLGSVSREDSLPGSQTATFLLCPYVMGRVSSLVALSLV